MVSSSITQRIEVPYIFFNYMHGVSSRMHTIFGYSISYYTSTLIFGPSNKNTLQKNVIHCCIGCYAQHNSECIQYIYKRLTMRSTNTIVEFNSLYWCLVCRFSVLYDSLRTNNGAIQMVPKVECVYKKKHQHNSWIQQPLVDFLRTNNGAIQLHLIQSLSVNGSNSRMCVYTIYNIQQPHWELTMVLPAVA